MSCLSVGICACFLIQVVIFQLLVWWAIFSCILSILLIVFREPWSYWSPFFQPAVIQLRFCGQVMSWRCVLQFQWQCDFSEPLLFILSASSTSYAKAMSYRSQLVLRDWPDLNISWLRADLRPLWANEDSQVGCLLWWGAPFPEPSTCSPAAPVSVRRRHRVSGPWGRQDFPAQVTYCVGRTLPTCCVSWPLRSGLAEEQSFRFSGGGLFPQPLICC